MCFLARILSTTLTLHSSVKGEKEMRLKEVSKGDRTQILNTNTMLLLLKICLMRMCMPVDIPSEGKI